jgi:cardiolipin synthase
MNEEQGQLLAAVHELAADLPTAHLEELAAKLAGAATMPTREWFLRIGRTRRVQERLVALQEMARKASAGPGALGLVLLSAGAHFERHRQQQVTEIAWTGPGTEAVPVRRVDQVMYELVQIAKRHILIVSYVAYRAAKAIEMVQEAILRGVVVDMVLERSVDAGGKLAFDSITELRGRLPQARILWWSNARREQGEKALGSMHAKCLVVDHEVALVSSANLTDYALERNMELGVVLHGGDVPQRLAAHFAQLILQGDLVAVE